jgi:hypothetical protein
MRSNPKQAPKPSPSKPGAVRGPVDGKASEHGTELPHERDESTRPGRNSRPDPAMRQAHQDLESGQADTDLRSTARQVFRRSPKASRPPKGS